MALYLSVCPHCSDKIPVDDERRNVFCMSCGASLVPGELAIRLGRLVFQKDLECGEVEIDPRAVTITAADTNARVSVYSDGKVVASIRKGETIVADIAPGPHTMWVRAGLEGSKKTEIVVREGDRLQVLYHGFKGYEVVRL